MMRRATWFAAGAAAGVVGASYTRRKVKAVANQLTPANVARGVADRARARGRELVEAIKEGRVAMRAKENQLRADRDADAVALSAPPAQIIVLSDLRQLEQLTGSNPNQPSSRERRTSADHPASVARRRRSRR